jgi:hypothetical protein
VGKVPVCGNGTSPTFAKTQRGAVIGTKPEVVEAFFWRNAVSFYRLSVASNGPA